MQLEDAGSGAGWAVEVRADLGEELGEGAFHGWGFRCAGALACSSIPATTRLVDCQYRMCGLEFLARSAVHSRY